MNSRKYFGGIFVKNLKEISGKHKSKITEGTPENSQEEHLGGSIVEVLALSGEEILEITCRRNSDAGNASISSNIYIKHQHLALIFTAY